MVGGSDGTGKAAGAASDTITGTKVVAASVIGSTIWHNSLRQRKS
nr:hypothetical protein [Neorhizobium xiangyangii]